MDKKKGDQSSDVVISNIEEMLKKVGPKNPEAFIYKVPKGHKKMNESVFMPQVISIGPFHNGRSELKTGEKYKLWALKRYLVRVNMSVKEAMTMAYSWDQKARSCYGHHIHMNQQDFAKMMLLDACFIIEFMIAMSFNDTSPIYETHVHDDDVEEDYTYYFFTITGINFDLQRDLTLVENQLPFFVPQQLYELLLSKKNLLTQKKDHMMIILVISLYQEILYTYRSFRFKVTEVRHLVDLFRMFYVPSHDTKEYERFNENRLGTHYVQFQTITELCEAGVKIYRSEEDKTMMDFKFENGYLGIPPFIINSNYEIHIRNLIVSEMLCTGGSHGDAYVFHYLSLLGDLIKTEKDVSILVKKEIIINKLTAGGSDQEIVKIIDNLRRNVPTFFWKFYYYHMKNDIDEYCKKRRTRFMASRHQYMAILRRDYFNTPWALISFLAATLLLILTLLQTLFSTPLIFHK